MHYGNLIKQSSLAACRQLVANTERTSRALASEYVRVLATARAHTCIPHASKIFVMFSTFLMHTFFDRGKKHFWTRSFFAFVSFGTNILQKRH
jgi:hypothetical protein